jgi:hypothetical protein
MQRDFIGDTEIHTSACRTWSPFQGDGDKQDDIASSPGPTAQPTFGGGVAVARGGGAVRDGGGVGSAEGGGAYAAGAEFGDGGHGGGGDGERGLGLGGLAGSGGRWDKGTCRGAGENGRYVRGREDGGVHCCQQRDKKDGGVGLHARGGGGGMDG